MEREEIREGEGKVMSGCGIGIGQQATQLHVDSGPFFCTNCHCSLHKGTSKGHSLGFATITRIILKVGHRFREACSRVSLTFLILLLGTRACHSSVYSIDLISIVDCYAG